MLRSVLVVLIVGPALLPAGAVAFPKRHECQKPVVTGVEVWGLHDVSVTRACPVALALFKWENGPPEHATTLYGCSPATMTDGARFPYLKTHQFRGWRLSLTGKYKEFTMSKGASAFHVGGTDFPLNCS